MNFYAVEKIGQRHYFMHSIVTGIVKWHIDQIIRNSESITFDILTQPPSVEVNIENHQDTSVQTVPIPDNVGDIPSVKCCS